MPHARAKVNRDERKVSVFAPKVPRGSRPQAADPARGTGDSRLDRGRLPTRDRRADTPWIEKYRYRRGSFASAVRNLRMIVAQS
jgi:hypothetical protein